MGEKRRAPGGEKAPRGAAAVEFALVVPILIGLTFGIISFGFMLSFRQSISQAAAEGARAAAIAPATADRVAVAKKAIERTLDHSCGTQPTDLLICTVNLVPAAAPTEVEVQVEWRYDLDNSKPKLMFDFALPKVLSYESVSQVNRS